MSTIEALRERIQALTTQIEAGERALHEPRTTKAELLQQLAEETTGLKRGVSRVKWYEGRNKSCRRGIVLRFRYPASDEPWVIVQIIRKDGTFGQERDLYHTWQLDQEEVISA